jgi:hypothetical protein
VDLSDRLRAQLEEILKTKSQEYDLYEVSQCWADLERGDACVYFLAAEPHGLCTFDHRYILNCLSCDDYNPDSVSRGSAYCNWDNGKIHIMAFVESEGYWRWGKTICGLFTDEEFLEVEINPGEITSQDYYDEETGINRLCKRCAKIVKIRP